MTILAIEYDRKSKQAEATAIDLLILADEAERRGMYEEARQLTREANRHLRDADDLEGAAITELLPPTYDECPIGPAELYA